MRMEAATACRAVALQRRVDLNRGSSVVPTIEIILLILAITKTRTTTSTSRTLTIDLSEGVLAVAEDFSPLCLAAIGRDLNPSSLVATTIDLNACFLCAWRTIVAGYLRCAARDDQSGERNKHPSGSRAVR